MKLIIAEKSSVGQSIAKVLKVTTKKDGFIIGSDYIISWCKGHLLELASPEAYGEQYSRWTLEDLPILPIKWQYTVPSSCIKQYKILLGLLNDKSVDSIICATDAGREGELIFRHVYESSGCKKPVQRLWITSLEDSAIRTGLNNLNDSAKYDSLYYAALCREKADWIVGMSCSRLFSIITGENLSVGRVITPTLAMLVDRSRKIADFQKEKYYNIELNCGGFTAASERFADSKTAKALCTACMSNTATVVSVESVEKNIQPPKLYDLTNLQRDANRIFGYTAQQTLECAQALYEKKLATYPRTDSQYITDDMAGVVAELVRITASITPLNNFPQSINISGIVCNDKVSDHHAIIPTCQIGRTDLAALPTAERNILLLISMRLLCATSDKQVYTETTVTLNCGDGTFTAKGKIIKLHGWKLMERAFKGMIQIKDKEKSDSILPELTQGQSIQPMDVALRERLTSPPKSYTEDTLLAAMESAGASDMPDDAERRGLGTPATRAGIIEKMIEKKFVERSGGKLIPLKKGIDLITALPDTIKSPMLTAEWETKLKQIEHGGLSADDFMQSISEYVSGIVKTYGIMPERKSIGRCPRCGAPVYEDKKNFACSTRKCGFIMWKNDRFFTQKKKEITSDIATTLLENGCVCMTGLFSEKKGKTYDAVVILDDTGGKYVNFKLDFSK